MTKDKVASQFIDIGRAHSSRETPWQVVQSNVLERAYAAFSTKNSEFVGEMTEQKKVVLGFHGQKAAGR